jgi:hypothetical protein
MRMRTFVFAFLVLAAMVMMVSVTARVIGQPPAPTEKVDDAVEDTTEGDARLEPGTSENDLPAVGGSPSRPPAIGRSGGGPASKSGAPRQSHTPGGKASGSGKMSRGNNGASGGSSMSPPSMMSGAMGPSSGFPGMMSGAQLSEDDQLELSVSQALAEYAATEDKNARKQQHNDIAKALDRIFDIRQERRMQELETLEQRVQKLRATLETREKLKSEILKNRLDYLTREVDGLGWGDGVPAADRSNSSGAGGSSFGGSFSSGAGGRSFGGSFGLPAGRK